MIKKITKVIEFLEAKDTPNKFHVFTISEVRDMFDMNMAHLANELRLHNYAAAFEDKKTRLVVVRKS